MLREEVERSLAAAVTRPPIRPAARTAARPRGRGPTRRLVALGGGTGLPTVLRGLKDWLVPSGRGRSLARDRQRLTAIVSVADDGGSSGRLRRDYGVPPTGDIRNCLLALAEERSRLSPVFDFRFAGDGGLGGHSLGNLILTALCRMEKDFFRAVQRAEALLAARGRVLPATLHDVSLLARYADGSGTLGESRIPAAHLAIRRVSLVPPAARALPEAIEALERANRIVIGPGSLYTSLIPILLVPDLAKTFARTRARVVLVMNLMTEPGETDGFDGADILLALRRHAPDLHIHDVLINTTPIPSGLAQRYAAQGAAPIRVDARQIRSLGCRPIERDLLGPEGAIRHDSAKLARALLEPSPWAWS